MDLYMDYLTTKGFSLEDFKGLAYKFKETAQNALFKSEYVWLDSEIEEQELFLEEVKKYFSKYTSFGKLEVLKTTEGFWLRPYFGDYTNGGKYAYLDDIITAEYVLNLNGFEIKEEDLKVLLPYQNYFNCFKEIEMKEPLGFWVVNKELGYNKVRESILKNINKIIEVDSLKIKEKSFIMLGENIEITVDGFPPVNKEELVEELKVDYECFERKDI